MTGNEPRNRNAKKNMIQDETGKEVEKRNHGQTHIRVAGISGIPEKTVRDIMTRHPLHTFSFK
jgi:hypothetical protein